MAIEERFIYTDDDVNRISPHLYKALLTEYVTGNLSANQCVTALESYIGEVLTTAEKSDLQHLVDLVDAETGAANKYLKLDEIYRVLSLASFGHFYNSVSALKTRLGFS